jgi:hypothetical protein
MHDLKAKKLIVDERKKGLTISELSKKFEIPFGTVFSWVKDLELSNSAKASLELKRNVGRNKGLKIVEARRNTYKQLIQLKVNEEISKFKSSKISNKLLCSFLFWGEGAKALNSLKFINSDPEMIKTFLGLFRDSFELDETKFRVVLHLHEYHDEVTSKDFWSNVTKIPLNQFNKIYLKPNSGINTKAGYKGCISIRYYDSKIAQELFYLYNTFSRRYTK